MARSRRKRGFFDSLLFETGSVRGELDTFWGRRNRLTGRTKFRVYRRGGGLKDAWEANVPHSSFAKDFLP